MSFNDKKKANTVIIDAIMNLMTTRQRDDEDLTEYTKCFKVARDLCKEKYGGIFKIPMLTQKEFTWGSDQETTYKTVYTSFLSQEYRSNKAWFIHQEDGRRLCHRVGEHLPDQKSRMHNIFCPSTSMIKLIMISRRSNETITTKVACPQRMKILQPLGM